MYRFMRTISPRANTVNHSIGTFPGPRSCTLCNQGYIMYYFGLNLPLNNMLLSRHVTTEELLRLQKGLKKMKKCKKLKKRYAELIEIKGDSSNVTKAVVKNLSPKDVSTLMNKPESSLGKLYQSLVKDKKSESVVSGTNNEYNRLLKKLSQVKPEDLEKNQDVELSLIWRNKENVDVFSDAGLETAVSHEEPADDDVNTSEIAAVPEGKISSKPVVFRDNSNIIRKNLEKKKLKLQLLQAKEIERKENDRKIRNERLEDRLVSYIEVCIHNDQLNTAYHTVARYVRKHRYLKYNVKLGRAESFNKLIHGFANKGNIHKILELLGMMDTCDIRLTPQTFAGCFECLGRLSVDSVENENLKIIHQRFRELGYSFQDLVTECSYTKNQREFVMKMIHLLDPQFVPKCKSPVLYYGNRLLLTLNEKEKHFRSPAEGLLTNEELKERINEQIIKEMHPYRKIKSVFIQPEINEDIKYFRKEWNLLQDQWRTTIRSTFSKNLHDEESVMKDTKLIYDPNVIPYLKLLTRDQYADITMQAVRKLLQGSETYSPSLRSLSIELGKLVFMRYNLKCKQQNGVVAKMNEIYENYCQWYLNPEINADSQNTRQQWQRLLHEHFTHGPSVKDDVAPWSYEVLRDIGKFLYRIIAENLEFNMGVLDPSSGSTNFVRAFYKTMRTRGRCAREEIKPHPKLMEFFQKTAPDDLYFDVDLLPMMSPPLPWVEKTAGGYLFTKVSLVRLCPSLPSLVSKICDKKLYPVFDSLNQLASVPWRINESVLEVMLKVFTNGGSDELDVPRPGSSFDLSEVPQRFKNALATTARNMFINQKKMEMHSLWCETLYRLSLANHYRKRLIWLPHNMDFRGRVYPVPPHLTHLGSDKARSLLQFAKGEKLGPNGLDWLKIHCINLTGLKKRESTYERLKCANELLPEILDSAEKPLTGKMWWAEFEDKWQTLACCMEIKAVLESGDPENYISYFPVHQDGSCNGLQHYAALGRDKSGGESVNLTISPVPQDVYSVIVEMVENERKKDANMGIPIAKSLEGCIARKVIKQTVMTTVYGVTEYGAHRQIMKQLKDIKSFPDKFVWDGSQYLCKKTFFCLREMFTSTKKIQNWLTDCARTIVQEHGSCVQWETPLDLPVMQPYMKDKKPNSLKQKQAFPPNYIHSLDSSHMMLTSLFCERKGITFVSVHDCYWTHACTVNILNKICREQFITLHSQPLLEDLSKFFIKTYINADESKKNELPNQKIKSNIGRHIFNQVPDKGTLNLSDILRSEYFFS